ncbi:MAG: Polyphosphate kinase 2, family [Caulobacter sp.]|nr:Polyphosphate kinase 2, family [Caulobacter sp.]
MSKSDDYDDELETLQLGLIKLQRHAMAKGHKLLVIFEGRDAAGKDGAIARLVEHLSPRATRVVALPKPTEREQGQWYFERYVGRLPGAGEIVAFNRSWYNRAGVEPVMGFCTPEQHHQFLKDAPAFERMLIASGITIVKLWLDIDAEEQAQRLDDRRKEPLKAFKVSDMDAVAQKKWDAYTAARDEMLLTTHMPDTPWLCVRGNHKKPARLAILRAIIQAAGGKALSKQVGAPDPQVLFTFEPAALTDGRLAR